MGILDDTHNLYTTGHIFDPFLAYFIFGYPFLALAIAGIWEIGEYVVFETMGHYSVFFLNESVGEEMWDVLILDIGGTLVGTLIAANLNFFLEQQFVPSESPWARSDVTQRILLVLWWVLRAAATMPLSALGWECNTVVDMCTDTGYHLFPWGVPGLILVNGVYIWYYFRQDSGYNRKAYWMLLCLCVINAPTLQREVPASTVQIIGLGGLSILEFLVWCILACQPGYQNRALKNRAPRTEYTPVQVT